MKKIVIASACRTAIGKFGGTLANVPAVELGSIVIKEALNRANVKPEQVDHVYMGCVIQAGLGQNVARQASLKAGLPIETPAVTVNVVCGSGLNCVNMAAQMIEAGDADIVVAGGMENMDMAPFAMMKARYGRIVNLSSVVALRGNAGQANYAASKAGLIGLTKSLAKELAGRNITVNAVAPGLIETDMTAALPEAVRTGMLHSIPAGRAGKPEDVANAAAFFAAEQSSYLTGQVLCVDGGMAM